MKVFAALFIVIASIIGAVNSHVPYKEFEPYPFAANNTCPAYSNSWVSRVRSALRLFGRDRLITDAADLVHYAEDYGHIHHRVPKAVFVPTEANDIATLMRVASLYRFTPDRFQIVVRGGSGNVQGATQTACDSFFTHQILLDTSLLNSIQVSAETAWVGAGASWLSFVEATASENVRPTVIPDYLGLTMGGWIGIGGFGADSAGIGPAIDQVVEIELVTPAGNIITVGPGSDYFKAVRGGMGVFGVMTRIKFLLESNDPATRVYHILTADYEAFFAAMRTFLDLHIPSKFQGLQSFVVPNTPLDLEIFVAPAADLDRVRASVDEVLASNQTYVYYLELQYRGSNPSTVAEVAAMLPPGINPDLIFFSDYPTPVYDNRLKLFTVPALVANGAWYVRHPWGSFAIPDSSAATLKDVINNLDPFVDLGYGLLSIYPYTTNTVATDSFLSVPRSDDYFYLITVGRNDMINTPESLAYMGQDNRDIWNQLVAAGDARIYPSLYMPDFGPQDWQQHFGSSMWADFRRTKKLLDPLFLLGDQRNFGFASLYTLP
eukprot:TRINITY_DN3263_c0_g1_i1.p1 TRINITY_DN3263_c0_g1~~TRINITY_DN3263_c0_g1_i1.p1  ORF type:complete len:548 (+),score=100.68 TRINITY_DN3263_c0_g1_i1:29-1672(+)